MKRLVLFTFMASLIVAVSSTAQKCKANEVFDTCPAPCPPQRCDVDPAVILCAVPPKPGDPDCKPGCRCIDNYLRNSTGCCIPKKECPQKCKANEVFDICPAPCPPQRCDVDPSVIRCAAPPEPGDSSCEPGCRCIDGYLRNSTGSCIPKKQCPEASCGGDPNAHSGCGLNCGRRCSNYKKHHVVCPDICKVNGCDCNDGYVLDENFGLCVHPKDCSPKCDENEVPTSCANGGCGKFNCSQVGQPDICIDPIECKKGCVCKENYLRADNGTCVPISQCTSCNNDPNARPGCGINCNKRCSNVGQKEPQFCILVCYENACDCKDGYYLDENTGKCVLPKDCTPTCPTNEIYSTCANEYCATTKCSQLGHPIFCPATNKHNCTAGCICKDNYLRADNGTCIPKEECPSCGGDPNAVSGCGVNCGRLCSNYNSKQPVACPAICNLNGCDCRKGFVFDSNTRKCVLPKNCSPQCDKLNEIYDPCPPACPPQTCDSIDRIYDCPLMKSNKCASDCKGACRCIPDYFRNSKGECVSKASCNSSIITPISNTSSPCTDDANVALSQLAQGVDAMNAIFMKFIYKENPSKSFACSALSVLIAYGQLALYAVGVNKEQLNRVLNLENNCEIKAAFPAFKKLMAEQTCITLELAVKLYGNKNLQFNHQFIEDSQNIFNASVGNVDFSNSQAAADEINQWVAKNTNNEIQNLVSPSSFDANTVLAILNAIYFLADWEKQFNPDKTRKMDFYTAPNVSKSIDFMQQQSTFNYGYNEELKAQTLQMYYKGGNASLFIWLPDAVDGIGHLINKLNDYEILKRSRQSLEITEVNVQMPKFEILTELNIADLSKKDNVTELYNPNSDGFHGILKQERPVYASAAMQKIKIKVDEKGTMAAISTAIVVSTLTAIFPTREVVQFNANHPFLFELSIRNITLLSGVYAAE